MVGEKAYTIHTEMIGLGSFVPGSFVLAAFVPAEFVQALQ
jgi:hypothetical protein